MPKYDIRKAINKDATPLRKEDSTALGGAKDPQELQGLEQKLDIFDSLVSHSYLNSLEHSKIKVPEAVSIPNMGWYKITKIVLDKEQFFPDQLSMLYTALHNVACNVALLIHKKDYDDFEIYLGARDFGGNLYESATLLGSAINGFLPGVQIERKPSGDFPQIDDDKNYVASYSGVASLKDDKKENFIQGIEKFVDATLHIPTYEALFIADNIGSGQVNNIINAYGNIRDSLTPFLEIQETFSENETNGVSKNLTESLSTSLTDSISETVTRSEGANYSYSLGKGSNKSYGANKTPNIIKSLLTKIIGGETYTYNKAINRQESEQNGSYNDFSKADQKSFSSGKTKQESTSEGTNSSTTIGTSKTIVKNNTIVKRYVDIIDRNVKRLENGLPYGLWSVGTYFISPDDSTSRKLANIYRGCITGEESNLDANAVNVWNKKDSSQLLLSLKNIQNPRFFVGYVDVTAAEIVTSKELAIHMSLPQNSIPGIEVRDIASFGRNTKPLPEELSVDIGRITHLGNISPKTLGLDLDELSKHVFITGSTGSGKSNTVYLLINELLKKGKKILIVEPTKGDYKKVFGGRNDIIVYGTRMDEKNLLRINPFAFPDGIKVVEHVERLIEIFGVCWPMYAAMPAILKNSILSAYTACGWNLKTSQCKYGRLFPTVHDVVIQLKLIINTSQYSSDTKGDYIGALQTRLESLTNGIYETILCSSDAVDYQELYDKNAIIDIHHIGSSETRSLLMGLLILGLTEWRMAQGEDKMDQKLQHITILEEAHNILPRVSKQQSQEGSNILGKSVEMIASAIAEMRTYGESFIIVDQSPSAVDEAAIRNTNTKIIMNLPDGDDREIAGKAISLTTEDQFNELARLSTGEAIAWQRGWNEPIFTTIFEMKEKSPLNQNENMVKLEDKESYSPHASFIKFFVLKDEKLSESERNILSKEILKRDVRSGIKAKLLEEINRPNHISKIELYAAIIDFLGIKQLVQMHFSRFEKGSVEVIRKLRYLISTHLNINNSKTQNYLISIIFRWASNRKEKWNIICKESLEIQKTINKK